MTSQIKTIRNPMPRNNVADYIVTFSDGSSREVKATGGTNAWFISRNVWPNAEISSIEKSK